MKKLSLMGLSLFGVVALTGCDWINKITNPEKSYNYNDYKVLLADRHITTDKTKAIEIRDVDGAKTSHNYTYKASDEIWEEEGGGVAWLNIIPEVITCELAAAFYEKTVDEIFDFYATNDSYRVTGEYKTETEQVNLEMKYNSEGLKVYAYTKTTNLQTVSSSVRTSTYTYSVE